MTHIDELGHWLRLLLTPGVGNVGARRLLTAFGLPQAIFEQSAPALKAVVGPKAAQALSVVPADWSAALERLQSWLDRGPHCHVLTLDDPRFPPELLQIPDPPLLLYVRGQLDALHQSCKLAMVGSRNPTPQGQANAEQFARALGQAGVCVVSGLALGVDGAAHHGALAANAPTVAVVGTGVDRVYPKQHLSLAQRIVERGAIVSEYALGTAPVQANFPRRNRLIAGLAQGTLVVEAAAQSGSLITARLAAEQGRDVFAIPGSIHAPQSRGCHALIKQGAKLVESAQDILEELHNRPAVLTPASGPSTLANTPAPALAGTSAPVCAAVASNQDLLAALGFDPVSFDVLQIRSGFDTAHLQFQLLELELQGHISRLPGGLIQRQGK